MHSFFSDIKEPVPSILESFLKSCQIHALFCRKALGRYRHMGNASPFFKIACLGNVIEAAEEIAQIFPKVFFDLQRSPEIKQSFLAFAVSIFC